MVFAKTIYVIKFDGRLQPFEKEKIIRTCMRMHATEEIAQKVADRIEERVYDGISTKNILQMIFAYMRKYRPEVKHMIDLRTAISLLRPKPDFELFVAQVLRAYGYKVKSNQMIAGRCIEHEIDAIAEKDEGSKDKGITYVEVKHHYNPHTYTGLGVFLEARATFEDLTEGYVSGKNKIRFDKALVVINTKLSEHALQYAECRGIAYIGWKAPVNRGLEWMIEGKRLYPITLIRDLGAEDEAKFGDVGIVTLLQMTELSLEKLWSMTKIPKKTLRELRSKAQELLSS
jgi:hypothetical protein